MSLILIIYKPFIFYVKNNPYYLRVYANPNAIEKNDERMTIFFVVKNTERISEWSRRLRLNLPKIHKYISFVSGL